MKKCLFVCSGNKLRSPTAEIYFREKGYETQSAGTSKKAVVTVSIKQLKWADEIFVMEEKHKQRLKAYFPKIVEHKKIEVLNIPDDFKFMDDKLIAILKNIQI